MNRSTPSPMVYAPRTAGRSALSASLTVIRNSAVQSSGVSSDADSADRSAGDRPTTSTLAESAEIGLSSMRGGVSERAAAGGVEWQAEAPKETRIAATATAILVIDRLWKGGGLQIQGTRLRLDQQQRVGRVEQIELLDSLHAADGFERHAGASRGSVW